jgi:hypothetical protein
MKREGKKRQKANNDLEQRQIFALARRAGRLANQNRKKGYH